MLAKWGSLRRLGVGHLGTCGVLVLTLGGVLAAPTVHAMPVFDGSNFAQNWVTAIESVKQTLQQIDSYRTQLFQAQQMVRDGVADIVYTWDSMVTIYDRVAHLDEEVERTIDEAWQRVDQLRTAEYYRTSPCYGSNLKCYRGEWERTVEGYRDWQFATTESQQKTLGLVMKQLQAEGEVRAASEDELQGLQETTAASEGQWTAIQSGNMIALHQARDLKAVRALLVQLINMQALQWSVELEERERARVLGEQMYQGIARVQKQGGFRIWPVR